MSHVLAVFGATGQQGSSVVNHVLSDAELSRRYKVRAITRDVAADKAKLLSERVEVVSGDTSDRQSIEKALKGVHTVYVMTVPAFGPDAVEAEFKTAKMIADIAVEKGVKYMIFSTLPAVTEMSQGKYTNVTPFDAKAKAEAYIRSLPIKSSFCSLGSFMENFQAQKFLAPKLGSDGNWEYSRPVPASTKLPMLNAIGDTGKFVGAILADPDEYEGKTLCAATAHYTQQEIVDALSKSCGKPISFKQVSWEEFRQTLPWIPDVWIDAFRAQEEYGYFGPHGESLVAWAASQARGKLSTLDEYLAEYPFQLE
ncbi:putative hscarg dehydrogenase [Rhypophila sp. PSN 637]